MTETNEVVVYDKNTFEDIKHIDENGNEYWEAREFQIALDYSKWENFIKVIDKAKTTCSNSKYNINEHFPEVRKTLEMPNNASKTIVDFNLSRYACYLIVQNADSRKKVIALGQTYFAVQTRKQELTEQEYNLLTEDEKRLYKLKLNLKEKILKVKKKQKMSILKLGIKLEKLLLIWVEQCQKNYQHLKKV